MIKIFEIFTLLSKYFDMSKSPRPEHSLRLQRNNEYPHKVENVFSPNRKFVIDGNSLRVGSVDIKMIDGMEIWFITSSKNNSDKNNISSIIIDQSNSDKTIGKSSNEKTPHKESERVHNQSSLREYSYSSVERDLRKESERSISRRIQSPRRESDSLRKSVEREPGEIRRSVDRDPRRKSDSLRKSVERELPRESEQFRKSVDRDPRREPRQLHKSVERELHRESEQFHRTEDLFDLNENEKMYSGNNSIRINTVKDSTNHLPNNVEAKNMNGGRTEDLFDLNENEKMYSGNDSIRISTISSSSNHLPNNTGDKNMNGDSLFKSKDLTKLNSDKNETSDINLFSPISVNSVPPRKKSKFTNLSDDVVEDNTDEDYIFDDEETDDEENDYKPLKSYELVYLEDTIPEDFDCIETDCNNVALFCSKGGNIPTHCSEHKNEDMIHIYFGYCNICTNAPKYHLGTTKYCEDHKPKDVECQLLNLDKKFYPVNVPQQFLNNLKKLRILNKNKNIKQRSKDYSRICVHDDCTLYGNFGAIFPDEKRRTMFCKKHLDYYVNTYPYLSLDRIITLIYDNLPRKQI